MMLVPPLKGRRLQGERKGIEGGMCILMLKRARSHHLL